MRDKWNRIYAEAKPGTGTPARVLTDFVHLLPHRGEALDFACGMAPDGIFLARRGIDTLAVDISNVAVDKLNDYAREEGLPLRAESADLEDYALRAAAFDVIVVVHYLDRTQTEALAAALKPGGLLFFQTFTREVTDNYSGPSNPDFRLARGELLTLFSQLRPVAYREEGLIGDLKNGLRNEAMLIAQRPAS